MCGRKYVLGSTGTVLGCDNCQNVMRKPKDQLNVMRKPKDQLIERFSEYMSKRIVYYVPRYFVSDATNDIMDTGLIKKETDA
jgi:hypothetical protein